MHSYRKLLERSGSKLTPLKSTCNAEKFHTLVVLDYLEWFRRNSLLKCVLQPNIAEKKSQKIPILGFKVIHVGTAGKVVSSACSKQVE